MPDPAPPLLGEAPTFRAMLAEVSRLAPLARPVLILGERGTGKELVASRLALLSPRWERPFLKLNCAALGESLLEAELFGHEAGAFTGALRRRAGRFEAADGGTLFLDEIALAPAAVQERLLRVIEYGSFERLGSSLPLSVDVRVLAATNADLPALAAAGRFRADLLDRLAFDVIAIPPLREREGDVRLLAEHFAARMAAELGRPYFAGFAPQALAVLESHPWPGNVRELRNVVERSLARDETPERPLRVIRLDPFPARAAPAGTAPASTPPASTPPAGGGTSDGGDFSAAVAAFEADLLRQALVAARYNRRAAALRLGLGYDQLRHLLKRHHLGGRHAR